jgi:hypothetical protein
VELADTDHSLKLDEADVNSVRERDTDVPLYASDEERQRRKEAWEAAQARALYEEMVLKKPKPQLVQLGGNGGNGKGIPVQPEAPASQEVAAHGDD